MEEGLALVNKELRELEESNAFYRGEQDYDIVDYEAMERMVNEDFSGGN